MQSGKSLLQKFQTRLTRQQTQLGKTRVVVDSCDEQRLTGANVINAIRVYTIDKMLVRMTALLSRQYASKLISGRGALLVRSVCRR